MTKIDVSHFTDARIAEINSGHALTYSERTFLERDTISFEECSHNFSDLRNMTDKELMNAAYAVWADYARGQS